MRRTIPRRLGDLVRNALPPVALLCMISGDVIAQGTHQSAFDWGYRLRLRQEYLANVYDFSESTADDYNYIRVRSQLWGSWAPNSRWKLYAMLNNEHRHWFKSNKGLENKEFEIHELIFENLYFEGKRLGGSPFGFVVGRQNLLYGEGLICWDGGPLDGSRTAYFNALLLTAAFEKRRLEAHFISDPKRDNYFPVVNDQDQALIERNEQGAGIYYSDESFAQGKLEAYYFYKEEGGSLSRPRNRFISTIGARASGKAIPRLTFSSEWAGQFGSMRGIDHRAFGGYLTLKYEPPMKRLPTALSAGGIYLSGDDPATGDEYEGWAPVYSRWPKWSELYIYALARESISAYWTNLASPWIGLDIKTADGRVKLETRLSMMWAPDTTWCCSSIPGAPPRNYGVGHYRGTLSTVKLGWKMNDYLDGYLLWERFRAGDYYRIRSDTAHFLRWEILFKY